MTTSTTTPSPKPGPPSPPSAPLPAMTAAELQCTREWLGLTRAWLANDMALNERRLARMEAGQDEIPDALISRIDDIAEDTKTTVHDMVAEYRRKVKLTGNSVMLRTYRKDEDYKGKYTAAWHRMLCARLADGVPGLVLVYE